MMHYTEKSSFKQKVIKISAETNTLLFVNTLWKLCRLFSLDIDTVNMDYLEILSIVLNDQLYGLSNLKKTWR